MELCMHAYKEIERGSQYTREAKGERREDGSENERTRTNPFLVDDENTSQRAQRLILQHIVRKDRLYYRTLRGHLGRKSFDGRETGEKGRSEIEGRRGREAAAKDRFN